MNSTPESAGLAAGDAQRRLDALSPQQRARLMEMARAKRGATGGLHRKFEAWARRQPQAIAVSCGEQRIGYGELDARASALAARLLGCGLGRGDLVAITLDRGIDLIVAILAVLKAGGAYLPIDPAVPEERQRFIRDDADARIALSSTAHASLFADYPGRLICLDASVEAAVAPAELPEVDGADLAYVIYTSGSTGQPKGVMIEHRHVARLFSSAEAHFSFSADDIWTLFHSYAFDFSVWEIWGALLYGGRLVIVPHAVSRSPQDMARLVIEEGVTVLNQTPTAFSNLMTELLARADRGALRYVIFGGEALEPRRLTRWFEHFGDSAPMLINMYGITETTVHVTYKHVRAQDAADGISDIGEPLADLNLYVLNERGRPVPTGAIGELYVAGAGLARGYLNRPELTAERFIDHPSQPGERLYRTGDMARRLDGGRLEYMGRNDDQVKLRGFRIELGDIERQLIGHASVRDAVAAIKGEGEERCLAAYVVLSADAAEAADGQWKSALHRHLIAALPDYMVPGYIVALNALPVTNNGKIDRASLAPPAPSDVWQQHYVAPSTPAEHLLCELIAKLLKLEQVGAHDNFFALGGDSLKTVNLVAGAKAAGLHLQVADVFAHPCVVDLAAAAMPAEAGDAASVQPFELIRAEDRARLPAGVVDAYPMSRLQQGMVYHNLASADNSLYHNVLSQRYRGELDMERMRRAIGEMMQRHEVLRTSFHLEGYAEPLQLVHERVEVPLYLTDLAELTAEQQDRYIAEELRRLRAERIELARPPMFQAHVYRIGEQEIELIWLEHHAILDGWSLASLMTQLMARYAALADDSNAARAVSPPSSRYRDFIAAERRAIDDEQQAGFWKDYVDSAPYTQLQYLKPEQASASRQIEPIELSAELFARCRALAGQLGLPLKSLFLAAYARVMGKFSGETELMLGLTTHGRPEAEHGDDLVGLYVSTHPLRLSSRRGSWRELIQHCFRAESELWPRRFYPLSEIKRLHGGRELFDSTFTYNHFSVTENAEDIGVRATRAKRAFEFNDTGLGVAFVVMDMNAGLGQVHVTFDNEKFDRDFAARIQECLRLALRRMTDDVDAIADVLPEADQRQVARLARAATPVAADDHLIREFARWVGERADASAVEQGGSSLSYAELDARASRLAARLRDRGVRRGDLIGFDTLPSLDMICALIAAFKLGAVFVPLDPEQSAARLRIIVEESALAHVLADTQRWSASLPEHARVYDLRALAADVDADADAAVPPDAGLLAPRAEELAYVIYTSGSSGRPKGVAIDHGNAVSFLRSLRRLYGLRTEAGESGERLLQVSNIGFDIFIEEVLATLFSGGTLVLRATPRLPDASEFWQLIDAERIHLVHPATAYWNLLCAELPPRGGEHDARSLRLCIAGGEAMPRPNVERWLARWGTRIGLLNSYGPTETTVAATVFDTAALAQAPQRYSGVPIGRPLDNCSCVIVGADLLPVPRGVAGELLIGGAAVSPGYLNQPEQTAERFVEWGEDGALSGRYYRTGDLVRMLEDGQLEFVGRLDGQVKIRGFRVEVEEVRGAIGQAPGVKHCAVCAVRSPAGDLRLAAYLVLEDGAGEDALTAVEEFVRARLPSYMRPSAWMRVDALPMTPNRKLDLRALPAPDFEAPQRYIAPRNALETQVQELWQAVLNRPRISIDADFFAVGGHSLLLTRLLLRIDQQFQVEVSMAELMRARSIREMADLIAAARSVRRDESADRDEPAEELEW